MPESNDETQEPVVEETSPPTSPVDYQAQATHFQSIADKRDADNKTLKTELDGIKAAQEQAKRETLEEQKKYQELYEGEKAKVEAAALEMMKATLQLKLQAHLNESHPDYAGDYKWIAPLVTSEEDIASVAEDYVKAHPRAAGSGTANLGNTGSTGEGQKTISQADLNDPLKVKALLEENPNLAADLKSGELKAI